MELAGYGMECSGSMRGNKYPLMTSCSYAQLLVAMP